METIAVTPNRPKRSFAPALSSARRASTGTAPTATAPTTPIKHPPRPSTASTSTSTSTSTGFRSLRSLLLPFGHSKHSHAPPSTPNTSKTPFYAFGSVRRSAQKAHKAPVDVRLPPVISIDKATRDELDKGTAVRRSVSCSVLQPVEESKALKYRDGGNDVDVFSTGRGAPLPILRTPSPGPPISAELSTILEADSSGISKHIPPSFKDPSCASSLDIITSSSSAAAAPEESLVTDTFILDLSTTHLEDQVLGAMRSETSSKPQGWNVADHAIIIDADGEDSDSLNAADQAIIIDAEGNNSDSLNLNALDPDLAAILSPHSLPAQRTNANVKNLTLNNFQKTFHDPLPAIFSNEFVLQPSPIINSAVSKHSPSSLSPLHLRLPRQQSSLPRLRPPISPSPHSSPHSPSPSTVVPNSSASDSTFRAEDTRQINPVPLLALTSPKTIYSPLSPPTASMSSFFSRRSSTAKSQSSVPALSSSQPATSSPHSRLRTPLTHHHHMSRLPPPPPPPPPGTQTQTQRPTSSPEADFPDPIRAVTPSSSRASTTTTKLASLDSPSSRERREIGNFDRPRPSVSSFSPSSPSDTHHFETIGASARPSLDNTLRASSATDTENARTASAVLERARKRSLSVQERFTGRHTVGGPPKHRGAGTVEAERKGGDGVSEFGEQRPGSSQSMRMSRRWSGRRAESMTHASASASAPVTEWLGPRTVKAFKAAGLLDFERDEQQPQLHSHSHSAHSDRTGPTGNLSSSVGPPTHGRFASVRSASEYNTNARAPSRLAVSEAGGSSRRGSVSGTHGSMESPTFTASSGSRDTPRSASTAPTSVCGSSFAYLGRERDREKEEIRELKDKHASETEALLGALSDSQRTTKLLREENGELRDKLEQAQAEIDALRRVVGELTKETGDLRVQVQMLKSTPPNMSARRGGAVARPSRLSVPLHIEQDDETNDRSNLINGSTRERDKPVAALDSQPFQSGSISDEKHHPDASAVFSSTPVVVPKHKRRLSNTSSIFPVPPANMTMLLHDHEYDQDTGSLNDSLDHSQSSPSDPIPLALHDDDTVTRRNNTSLTSAISISPTTTANFSMTTTGSPASLFLRPEHELHLGDMDSLDLGNARNAEDHTAATHNDWE